MSKPNQAQFEEVPLLAKQFKTRYNRDVKVLRAITLGEDGLVNHATVHIEPTDLDDKYTITEYLTKEQKTDFVLSGTEEKMHKYNRYLDAEVYIADKIGEKRWQLSQKGTHLVQQKQ